MKQNLVKTESSCLKNLLFLLLDFGNLMGKICPTFDNFQTVTEFNE
jgi:hypothetical protein